MVAFRIWRKKAFHKICKEGMVCRIGTNCSYLKKNKENINESREELKRKDMENWRAYVNTIIIQFKKKITFWSIFPFLILYF